MPQWNELDRAKFREQHLCKVLNIESPAKDSDSVIVSHDILMVRCFLLPVTIIPVEQLYWDRKMPPFVDDEGNTLESNDQVYEENSSLNDDGEDEDEDDQELEEDDNDEGDMEERETPWVAIYRLRNGERMEMNLWREVDTEFEWQWKTPRRRWLMPTCLSNGLMRGIILERRSGDGGKFRRCGSFGYKSWWQSYEQGQDTFWYCSQDFNSAPGLEKHYFDNIMGPFFVDSDPKGGSLLRYKVQDNVMQFVISIM